MFGIIAPGKYQHVFFSAVYLQLADFGGRVGQAQTLKARCGVSGATAWAVNIVVVFGCCILINQVTIVVLVGSLEHPLEFGAAQVFYIQGVVVTAATTHASVQVGGLNLPGIVR